MSENNEPMIANTSPFKPFMGKKGPLKETIPPLVEFSDEYPLNSNMFVSVFEFKTL